MKFKVGLVVDEGHLGHVLAALQKFSVEMVGIDIHTAPVAPKLAKPLVGKVIEGTVKKSHKKNPIGRPYNPQGPSFAASLLDLIKAKGPMTTKEAVEYAKANGKTEQASYGALNAFQKRGLIHRREDKRWESVARVQEQEIVNG